MALSDYIDSVFLPVRKTRRNHSTSRRKRSPKQTRPFNIIVDQMPARAGIDCFNKLIDIAKQ
jgi:hypothetical protein